ncbi:hypothetical protein A6C57_23495 [Fibrella sp. ES10-3-2-2]|nr:hypothetical protein A6C57_23495 [Fibrella sp. ES10-3-2-2]
MTLLQVIGVLFLTLAAIMALALSFQTENAPTNYRNALFVLFVANTGVAAFLAYDKLNGLWGIVVVSGSLMYAVGVTLYNRTIMLTPAERRALFYNPAFWFTSTVCTAAIIVLMIIRHYQTVS